MANILVPKDPEMVVNESTLDPQDDDTTRRRKLAGWIAGNIGRALVSAYPGYNWEVEIRLEGGIAMVRCPMIHGLKGVVVHLTRGTIHDIQTFAVRGAGEALERAGFSRDRMKIEEIVNAKRDFRGNVVTNDV